MILAVGVSSFFGGVVVGGLVVFYLLKFGDDELPQPDQVQDFFKAKGKENKDGNR